MKAPQRPFTQPHHAKTAWLLCLCPSRQLKKKKKSKKNNENQSNKTRREKSRGVQRRLGGERERGKKGDSEQMSLFFYLFFISPSCCTRRIHVRKEGREGGGREPGRLGGGTCRGSGLMSTAAWQSCSILWPHTKHQPCSTHKWKKEATARGKNRVHLKLFTKTHQEKRSPTSKIMR